MRKALAWLSLAAMASAVLLGCGNSGTNSTSTEGSGSTASESQEFKVALLTPSEVSDAGWSAMAYDGLKAIESDLGARIDHQVAKDSQIKSAMRAYAQKGYNLVFGHGFEYNEPGVEVAADFPDTIFVSSSGSKTAKNAGAIRFYLEQSFYVAGAFAAKMSKTGVVGMVGGPEVPSIKSTFKAFRAGALAANPNVKVLEVFTGENDDIAKAKQAAQSEIGQKADVLIHQANSAAQGVFDACKEAGVYALGANLNQNDNESGVILASALIQAKPAFLELAKRVKEKKFDGDVVTLGMDTGAIDFVLNPALESKVPKDVLDYVKKLQEDVKSGKIVVEKDKF